jgi:hypothetical protein
MTTDKRQNPKKLGPKPERLAIPGDWETAVEKALKTPRPPGGWPKPGGKKKGREK